tara:strand:+ start:38 stop:781 length:744 start_codon:yes stop_codon:yes gene_type:complete
MNEPAIRFRDVRVRYAGAPADALAIEDLVIDQGEFVAVIGPSGAGKSTFLRAINGLTPYHRGQIDVFGKTYQHREMIHLRQQVSMVFQNFSLAPRMTVLENVLVGRLARKSGFSKLFARFTDQDREVAFSALQKVGLLGYALRDVRNLSGGQKQRVAIARSLAQEARIILADEPVASLDPFNSRRIIQLLKQLNEEQGITVIVNLHQVELVDAYFPSMVGLRDGRLAFSQQGSRGETPPEQWKKIYG